MSKENGQNIKENDEEKEKTRDEQIIDQCNQFIHNMQTHNLSCMLIAVHPKNGDPIIAYDGEQLNYTELACLLSNKLRNDILKRLGMS